MDRVTSQIVMDVARAHADLTSVMVPAQMQSAGAVLAIFILMIAFSMIARRQGMHGRSRVFLVCALVLPVTVAAVLQSETLSQRSVRSAHAVLNVACDSFEQRVRGGHVSSMSEQQASTVIAACGLAAVRNATVDSASHVNLVEENQHPGAAASSWIGVPRAPWKPLS